MKISPWRFAAPLVCATMFGAMSPSVQAAPVLSEPPGGSATMEGAAAPAPAGRTQANPGWARTDPASHSPEPGPGGTAASAADPATATTPAPAVRPAVAADIGRTAASAPAAPIPDAAAAAPSPEPAGSAALCCALAAGTPVSLQIVDAVNSGTAKRGDRVRLRLSAPLMLGDRMVLPAGIEGVGEVIHAERARGGGKGGELIVSARYLEGPRGRIRLRALKLGGSGADKSKTAIAVGAAAGLFGMLVRGGELEIPAGASAQARLAEPLSVQPPAADALHLAEAAAPGGAPATSDHDPAAAPPAPGDANGDTGETEPPQDGAETPHHRATSP